jgi:uncharacterized protein (TIGR03437 family)
MCDARPGEDCVKSFLKDRSEFGLFPAIVIFTCLGFIGTASAQTNTLFVTPPQLNFTGVPGQIFPMSVTAQVASGSVPITITPTSAQGWLGVSSNLVTVTATPLTIGVEINPVALAPGDDYDGSITFSGPGVTTAVVNVILNVTSGASASAFTASPATLSFSSTVAGPQQSTPLSITTTNSALTPVTIQTTTTDGSNWLTVSPQSGSVASGAGLGITVFANPGNLPVNSYTGAINVFASGSSTAAVSIPVSFKITAQATGPLAANPSPLSYNFVNAGAPAQSQTLTVSTTSSLVETVTLTPSPVSTWLSVGGNSVSSSVVVTANAPAQVSIGVNPSGLIASSYSGQITLSNSDLGTFTVPVQVNVGSATSSPLSATPDPINFSVSSGNVAAVSQQLTVTHSPSGFSDVTFTASAGQPTGQSWLSVTPLTPQIVGPAGTVTLTVSANPQTLSPGTYDTSEVLLTPSDGSTPLTIPVNLTVGGSASISLSQTNLAFDYQTQTAAPPVQTLEVTSSAASLGLTVTPSSSGWLMVTPISAETSATPGAPTPLTVQVNPVGLQPNTYQGTIQVASSGASNSPQTTNVTLVVSNQAVLTPNPGNVIFTYQHGSATLPPPQTVTLTSSGNQTPFSGSFIVNSGGNFVNVSASTGTSPGAIILSVNPTQLATLAPGSYQGTLEILASGAGNSPINIGVVLIVGSNPVLTPSQTNFTFNYEVGKALPVNQTLTVTSSGTPLTYSAVTTSTNCNNFLSVANPSGATPGTIALLINASDAPVGTCNGAVTVTAPGAANSPLIIPVSLYVSNGSLLNVTPAVVNLTTQVGTSPASQTISLTSTDPSTPVAFNVASTANGGNWLQSLLSGGTSPQNLTLGFQTASLAAGTYDGAVTVTPTALGSTPTVVPIQVVVTSSVSSAATPSSLTFTQPLGGVTPQSQGIQVTSSTPGLSFTASASVSTPSGGNWLSVVPGPGSATTPGSVAVSVNGANLGEGTYSGTITVLVPNATPSVLLVPVNFTIGPSLNFSASPNNLSFTATVGATTPPAAQTVMLASAAGAVAFTTSTSSSLLSVNPTSGTTPQTISIGLNEAALAALAASSTPYTGTVTVSSALGSLAINVSVTVEAAVGPAVNAVVNAASSVAGAVSPGEIISIYGTNIGPSTPQAFALTSSGTVPTTIGGTSVTFNNVPAPLTYVSGGQVNAIVPYEVSGSATAAVVITLNGVASPAISVNVAATAPAIFSTSQGGSGQGAILNQDSSVNSASNPAAPGSVISIYATGEGALTPQPATGSVTPSSGLTFPVPVATPINVTIGGVPAQINYAGEAPGLVSGVLQVNAVIPAGVASGAQTIVLTVGSATNSQQTITVAVQ